MAQVLASQVTVTSAWRPWAIAVGIGALTGVAYWVLAVLISNFIIEPLACKEATSGVCTNRSAVAGNVAAIIVGVASLFAMVRLDLARPLILAAGTIALLWGFGAWTTGLFWLESLGWTILLFALSFGFFAYVAKAERLWVSLAVSLIVVIATRVVLTLT